MTATEPRTKPAPPTDASLHTDYPDAVWMALVAVAAVGAGFFLCHLPYGRLATVLLSLAGTALAGLSLLGLTRRAWLGWVGVGLNALFVVLLAGFPDQFGLTGWWPVRAASVPVQTPGISADGWVDAGEAAWEENGVRVALTFATVAPPPAASGRASAEPNLWIGVRVTSIGTRTVDFTGWDTQSPDGPVLTAGGAVILGQRADAPKAKTLTQGQSAESVLVFSVPPPGLPIRLELPAAAYGGTTPARFQIAPELILRN